MRRSTVIATTAALFLSLTGAVAARQFWYEPFRDFSDRSGHVFRAVGHFRGEVRLYDASSKLLGSYGSDGAHIDGVSADVSVDGQNTQIRGSGRHELRDGSGAIIGYAELVPETAEQRAEFWQEHDRRLGIEERLTIPHGSNDGYGMATGYFGEGKDQIKWEFRGVGVVVFRRADNGRVVMRGKAAPITPELRRQLQKEMSPAAFAATVAKELPANAATGPIFITHDAKKTHVSLGGLHRQLVLSDGTKLDVSIEPYRDRQ